MGACKLRNWSRCEGSGKKVCHAIEVETSLAGLMRVDIICRRTPLAPALSLSRLLLTRSNRGGHREARVIEFGTAGETMRAPASETSHLGADRGAGRRAVWPRPEIKASLFSCTALADIETSNKSRGSRERAPLAGHSRARRDQALP